MTIIIVIIVLLSVVLLIKTLIALNWVQPPLQNFPKDFDLEAENITFKTKDGISLKGWFIPAKKQDTPNNIVKKTLILMHGFEMDKGDILPQTAYLAQEYNLFYFDFRGMGESSGKSAQGLQEYIDCQAAVKYLKKHKPEHTKEIALYGISLGASVAAYTAAQDKNIKTIILESCFYSYIKVASKWAWTHHTLPYFPVVFIFLRIKKLKYKIGLEDFSPKNSVPLIKCPVLQIHGKRDRLVPYKLALRLFDCLNTKKEFWLAQTGGHTSSYKREPEKYKETITNFLKKYF